MKILQVHFKNRNGHIPVSYTHLKVNTRFIQKKPDGMGTWLAIFDNDGDVHAAISKRPDTCLLYTSRCV